MFHNVTYPCTRLVQISYEKRSEETQTLRAGCNKAEPKTIVPPQTPFLGARDGQNLISWRWSLRLPKNPVWWGSMHAISSYRGNWPTHKHTDRTDYNTLRRNLARSVIIKLRYDHWTRNAAVVAAWHRPWRLVAKVPVIKRFVSVSYFHGRTVAIAA